MRKPCPAFTKPQGRKRLALGLSTLVFFTVLRPVIGQEASLQDSHWHLHAHKFPLSQGVRLQPSSIPVTHHSHFHRAANLFRHSSPLLRTRGPLSPQRTSQGTLWNEGSRRGLQGTVPADAQTLIQVKSAWGASFKQANTWVAENPCSKWFGVECNPPDSGFTVVGVSLPDQGLRGPLPAALGNLANLTVLNFTSTSLDTVNKFTGEIPVSFSKLTNLQILLLLNNDLSGNIPPVLGSINSLGLLGLGGNRLSGSIPPAIGQLTNLVGLDVSYNELRGGIPASLGNLKKLSFLITAFNQIQGPIPARLGDLVSISYLVLASNQLEGSIPASLGNLPQLQVLGLGVNRLQGVIPRSLGNPVNLTALVLGGNKLSGAIPSSIGTRKKLIVLDLSGNRLSKPVPRTFSQLTNLQLLALSSNLLTGNIPSFLDAPLLEGFGISSNRLTGTIPLQLSKLSSLRQLNLQFNYLIGPIPNIWPGLRSLKLADFSFNQLTGRPAVPAANSSTTLKYNNNFLTGGPFICTRFANVRNCFSNCPNQRTTAQCARFCGTIYQGGACGGHGYCAILGKSRTPTCRCFAGYGAPVRRPGTCKKRRR